MKRCKVCNKNKPLTAFYFRKDNKAFRNECKSCIIKARKTYRKKYRKKVLASLKRSYQKYRLERLLENKKYYRKNKKRIQAYRKTYNQKNKEYRRKKQAEWRSKNKDKVRLLANKYYHNVIRKDPLKKSIQILRNSTLNAITRKYTKGKRSEELLGAPLDDVRVYLEQLFKPGMSWKNHGKWHVDHIIPVSAARNVKEAELLCHYTNLTPLWKKENLTKNAKHCKLEAKQRLKALKQLTQKA